MVTTIFFWNLAFFFETKLKISIVFALNILLKLFFFAHHPEIALRKQESCRFPACSLFTAFILLLHEAFVNFWWSPNLENADGRYQKSDCPAGRKFGFSLHVFEFLCSEMP